MLVNWIEKTFSFLCRINSFHYQNTFERNFNLIINDKRLFNNNMRIGACGRVHVRQHASPERAIYNLLDYPTPREGNKIPLPLTKEEVRTMRFEQVFLSF